MTEDLKERRREASRKWRENNREKARASSKKWRERNPEKARASVKEWRERNLEKDTARRAQWFLENRDRALAENKTWRQLNKEYLKEKRRIWYENGGLEIGRKWRKKNPERNLFNTAKLRAKSRGVEFTIKLSDIVIPEFCPVFGCRLTEPGSGATAPSLDRIDNEKGYLPGNIKVISRRANHLKNGASIEEVEQILAYMKRERSYHDDQD